MDSDDSTWRNESLGARTRKENFDVFLWLLDRMDWHNIVEKLASRAQEPQVSFTG